MSKLAWSPALAAALLLSACATAEPVAQARDETGVVVATRPIVAVNTDVSATPASTSTPVSATAQLPMPGPVQAPPGALTTPTPPPNVRVLIIADAVGPGETQHGVSYTIRRDRDGTLFEVAQPETTALAKGTKVKIGFTGKVRITPAS